jgi:aminopeptidase C
MKIRTTFAALFAIGMLGISLTASAQEKKDNEKEELKFTVIKEAPITSVKNQNRSGTCWCFSSLGYFESEILRKTGKTYDLSEAFVVHHTMMDRAQAHVRMHGDISFSQGGSFYDVVYCAKNYGLCPESATVPAGSLYGDTLFDHNELDKVATAYVKSLTGAGAPKTLSPCWKNGLQAIYDSYLGKLPEEFKYEGKKYTPKTFAASLGLDWDDYVSLTSYTHHPFYEQFIIEVQDNWRWGMSYNLPLDEFMEVMDYAVNNGYAFAWGADVSESYFSRDKSSVATVPVNAKKSSVGGEGSDQERWIGKTGGKNPTISESGEMVITQELRQEAYDNWETTDDHGMIIYGIAKDQNGKEYYMMKNSWGLYGKYKGFGYISKAYAAYKTMNILINKNAIPDKIAKKLGLR